MPNPKTFDYLQFWNRNDVALNMPVLDHTDLKKKKKTKTIASSRDTWKTCTIPEKTHPFPNLGEQNNC